eukprot:m.175862 g.175862  ORF g.175862 m.175862 type:complete len:1518 (-) comp14065_c0_seq1:304-4857(-)
MRYPASLAGVSIHKPNTQRRAVIIGLFVALYAVIGYQCFITVGEPLAEATREIERLRDADMIPDEVEEEEAQSQKVQDKLNAIYGGAAPTPPEEAVVALDVDDVMTISDSDAENDGKSINGTSANGTATEEDAEDIVKPPMPPWYLPNPWATLAMFILITSHALFHLMCHWLVWFEAAALYMPADKVAPGVYVQVDPKAHRGASSIVEVTYSKITRKLGFTFQRQRYEYLPPGDEELDSIPADSLAGEGPDAFRLVALPVHEPVETYVTCTGLSGSEIPVRKEKYGQNTLSIRPPGFLELYRAQLLKPVAMFQFFTSALWLLDEYWQYTLFSLFNILMFESMTVFQRLQTLKTLSGMSTKPYPVYVYRERTWQQVSTLDLLPGDVVSLKRVHTPTTTTTTTPSSSSTAVATPGQTSAPSSSAGSGSGSGSAAPNNANVAASDVVPCDCVLLRGSAVANEATLTGESVPQMKDALAHQDNLNRKFDMTGADRVHVLFSGTSLVSSGVGSGRGATAIPDPPDKGCVAMVLRTGFASSQGELIQLIEFSQQAVSADSKEVLLALGLLLVCALIAAAYVLKKGLEKGDRTTHELLLKCVMIITSVVPQQLPMQMAIAVNTALMSLMRKGIMCTEPYRVQHAGKVTHCLFDKTGTLTTDQLVPAGIVCASSDALLPVNKATPEAATVLAACHSLVHVEGAGLIGDPIELAGIAGVQWAYSAATQTAAPGNWAKRQEMLDGHRKSLDACPDANMRTSIQEKIAKLEASIRESKAVAAKSTVESVQIVTRHHFASKLQRMSTIARVKGTNGGKSGVCCLVKGSPEAIHALLRPGSIPPWYEQAHRDLEEQGMRMLALGYRWCPEQTDRALRDQPRSWVEADLDFAGLIAFECKIRADSGTVIQALQESAHSVGMLTGDAPLTAYYVAKSIGMCDAAKPALCLKIAPDGSCMWTGVSGADRNTVVEPYNPHGGLAELSDKYELVSTEDAIERAAELSNGAVWQDADRIKVFARMSPQGKAKVIRSMQEKGAQIFMCGDGGNDVGALKQANVGLALLGGYGNQNTEDVTAGGGGGEGTEANEVTNAEEKLNLQQKVVAKKNAEIQKKFKARMAAKRAELMQLQQQWIQEEMEKAGGMMGMFSAAKAATGRLQTEMLKEQRKLQKEFGTAYSPASEDDLMGMEQAQDTLPIVRPGDASVAAPFTSRSPSVRAVVDLIRQGRCTLLSALQQQQIMMLQSLVAAYTFSALSLEGARSSERQLMASNWLILIASLAFSYSTPIEQMHPQRPLRSLFHPAIFVSMVGQAVIHLSCMAYAVQLATDTMGPAKLREVLEFHKKVRAGEDMAIDEEEDAWKAFELLWAKPFLPNLMNTVIFLVENAQIVAVLLVNYKGRPWMLGVIENHYLSLSLFLSVAGLVVCSWGLSPGLNELIHLEPFPDDAFRWKVISLVAISLVGTFVWDRLVTMIFAPEIFKAMIDEARQTRLKDFAGVGMTFLKVAGGLAIFFSGNLFIWIGFGWWYWKRRQQQAA